MRQLIFITAFLLPGLVKAQVANDSTVIKIRWVSEGEVPISVLRKIDGVGKNRLISVLQLETTIRRVLGNLQQRGFYLAQIDSVIVSAPSPTIIAEAKIYLTSKPKVQMAPVVSFVDSTLTNLSDNPKREFANNWPRELRGTYEENELRQRLADILEDFARHGHPLAQFNFDSVAVDEREEETIARIHLQFDPGPPVRIDSIAIRGNKLTKQAVLMRELPIRVGERFDFDRVQNIPDKLMRLGFLQSVAPPQLVIDSRGRYLLDIAVAEGNSNLFNGVAGYNPGVGNQKGYFTGLLDLRFGNLLGTGRQISVRWEKRGRDTQELMLRYREPWAVPKTWLGFPVHLAGGFQQLIQDTLYVERRWDLMAEVPIGQNFVLGGQISKESISPNSLDSTVIILPRSRILGVGASLRYDSTDDPLNPRRGVFYLTSVETGRKTVNPIGGGAAQKFSRDKIYVDFHWLLPIPTFLRKNLKGASGQVFSMALHGRQVTSSAPEISITDQFRFGGATSLRGYREEQFRGSRIAWSNWEYRYLLSRRSRVFLFFDVGYFSRVERLPVSDQGEPQLLEIEDIKHAWGFGARVDTPLGIVGVDYGLGEGDALTNGKVHVSLVNTF
jgi:outer membrane protein insertion porin family